MGSNEKYYTEQERIDAQTMAIKVQTVGSGYIPLPPQKRFESPVIMQPPTVAHLEYPDEYQAYLDHMKQRPGICTPTRPPPHQNAAGNGYRGQDGSYGHQGRGPAGPHQHHHQQHHAPPHANGPSGPAAYRPPQPQHGPRHHETLDRHHQGGHHQGPQRPMAGPSGDSGRSHPGMPGRAPAPGPASGHYHQQQQQHGHYGGPGHRPQGAPGAPVHQGDGPPSAGHHQQQHYHHPGEKQQQQQPHYQGAGGHRGGPSGPHHNQQQQYSHHHHQQPQRGGGHAPSANGVRGDTGPGAAGGHGHGRPGAGAGPGSGAAAGAGHSYGGGRPAGGPAVGAPRPGAGAAAGAGGRGDSQQLAQQLQSKMNIGGGHVAGSAASEDGDDGKDGKMSASQRKRMRKKMREKALAGK